MLIASLILFAIAPTPFQSYTLATPCKSTAAAFALPGTYSFDCGVLDDPQTSFDGISPACPPMPGKTTLPPDPLCMAVKKAEAGLALQDLNDQTCADFTAMTDKYNDLLDTANDVNQMAETACNDSFAPQSPAWFACHQQAYDAWYSTTSLLYTLHGDEYDDMWADYQLAKDDIMGDFLTSAAECCRYSPIQQQN